MSRPKTIEEKYQHAITVLQAIASKSVADGDNWRADAFIDCKYAAIRCLDYLGEQQKGGEC